MSLARLYETKKSRKVWTCGKCRQEIPVGSPVTHFAVGFRGMNQTRCSKPECKPTLGERESTLVANIYDAQESVDVLGASSLEEFYDIRQQIVDAVNEVAGEYEGNEMYDVNEDLQERVSVLEGTSSELENWEPDGEEPEDEIDCDECDGVGEIESVFCTECDGAGKVENPEDHDEWVEAARESLQAAIDEMELP